MVHDEFEPTTNALGHCSLFLLDVIFQLTNLKVILQNELNQVVIEQSNPDARVCGADVLIQGTY